MIRFVIVCLIVAVVFAYLYMIKPNSGREEQMKPYEDTYIAHRGLFHNDTDYPENSLKAFERAVVYGFGIELDVQLTKDGTMVVFHDANLKRMCGVDRILTECTLEELQQYQLLQTEEKIPLFDDVLALVDGKVPLIIEIKPEGDFIEAARRLSERMESYSGIYCMESFHPGAVHWFRKFAPDVIRGQLSTDFKANGIEVTPIQNFFCSNLLLNFYGKPDFIAYNHKYTNQFSYRLCRKLYHFENVGWTFRNQKQLEAGKQIFKVFIFDKFVPDREEIDLSKCNK